MNEQKLQEKYSKSSKNEQKVQEKPLIVIKVVTQVIKVQNFGTKVSYEANQRRKLAIKVQTVTITQQTLL